MGKGNQQSVDKYLKWFEEQDFSKVGEVVLGQSTTILDVGKFVDSHIPIIRSNWQNETFKPYGARLKELKEILIKEHGFKKVRGDNKVD